VISKPSLTWRKVGQLLKTQEKARGVLQRGAELPQSGDTTTGAKTLADMGISKDQSSRWQQLADVPDDQQSRIMTRSGGATASPPPRHRRPDASAPVCGDRGSLAPADGASLRSARERTIAMRGRKPTPTALRVLRGNPGKRRIPANEPQPPIKMPTKPDYVTGEAAEIWQRIVPQFVVMGTTADVDCEILASYCVSAAMAADATRKINRHGAIVKNERTGEVLTNPYVAVRRRCVAEIAKLGVLLGLGPAERARIGANLDRKPVIDQREDIIDRYFA
jgi:P27 family predicted phage terminase small subunit